MRQGDLVARLGGDEFAIIQANVRDVESSEKLAARIVESIGKPFDDQRASHRHLHQHRHHAGAARRVATPTSS